MAYYDTFIAAWNNPTQPPPGATGAPITAGMSTQQKLNTVNGWTAEGPAVSMIVPTYSIYNLVNAAEFSALADANKQLVRDVLFMGTVDCSPGTHIRSRIISVFPNGTQTFTNLANYAKTFDTPTIAWWQDNGYARPFDMGDCTAAGVS